MKSGIPSADPMIVEARRFVAVLQTEQIQQCISMCTMPLIRATQGKQEISMLSIPERMIEHRLEWTSV